MYLTIWKEDIIFMGENRYLAEERRRGDRNRICADRSGDRPDRSVQAHVADPARRSEDQRDFGQEISLRRHQERLREGRQGRQADGELSPAVIHADGMLRRRRLAQSGRRQLRLHGEFPGAVQHASSDGAGAARAGPKMRLRIPPDFGGSFGIKLSVRYVVLTALAAKITGRAVKWVEDRAEHLLAASSGPNRVTEIEAAVTRTENPRAEDGSARGLRRVPARADARAALPHARRGDRRLRHRQLRCDQPRRADEQDAGEPHPRLRRTAALSGAGAAGAADRGRAWARTLGRHSP